MNNYVLIKLWLKFPSIQLMKIFSWFWCILQPPTNNKVAYKHVMIHDVVIVQD